MKKFFAMAVVFLLLFAAVPQPSQAQQANLSRVAGRFVASQYNAWQGRVITGNAAAGAGTLTLFYGTVILPDGRQLIPFSTNAPLLVDLGANQETVTPTAVSGCTSYANQGTCQITATFSNVHGGGSLVVSGTAGLQEAINDANLAGGGTVELDRSWTGTAANISGAATFYNVILEDARTGLQYYYPQPTTLSALATPATRSAAAGNTQVISGTATGTWTAAATFVCVTYVDMLGGESPCSGSFSFTATVNVALNFAAPAASAGAVGWRAYAGLTGTSTQYQLPISASTCTLSTLIGAYPACAMGAAGVFPTPTTATALAPGYTVNVYRPNTQSHTTFGYVPFNALPGGPFQAHYGPFTATANVPAGQIAVLGTVPLPSVGFLNQIGKSIRVSGKITLTGVNTATPTIAVSLGPTFSTGTPTAICTMADTTNLTAAVNSAFFSCTMTTNAIGSSGTVMPDGIAHVQLQAGTTAGATSVDTGTAAITNGVDTAYLIYVVYTSTTAATNPAQLLDAHVEALN